jgi:hypothetical protein
VALQHRSDGLLDVPIEPEFPLAGEAGELLETEINAGLQTLAGMAFPGSPQ